MRAVAAIREWTLGFSRTAKHACSYQPGNAQMKEVTVHVAIRLVLAHSHRACVASEIGTSLVVKLLLDDD